MELTLLFSLLVVILSIELANTELAVTDHNLFVPYSDPVLLRVVNISKFSAHMEWSLPPETMNHLKAMRVNCTMIKSLVEPYQNNHPQIALYNPSISGTRITISDLKPATQYSCSLVGALSLDAGKEQLVILSQPAIFSTLMENEGNHGGGGGSNEPNVLNIVLGIIGGLLLVLVASLLIYIGYRRYKQSGGKGWQDGGRRKFRMRLARKGPRPDDSPPPPSPDAEKPRSKKERKPTKSHRDKMKPSDHKLRPPKEKSKHKYSERSGGEGKSASSKSKTKKTSKKNKNYNHAYNYSELQTRSSEDEIFGYKDTEVKHELTSDLGWDPMTYYPNAAPQKAFVPKHIQARVKQKEMSSPTLVVQGQNDADSPIPSTYTKGEHYQPHFAQPLY